MSSANLDDISAYLLANYRAIAPAVERRIRVVLEPLARWPESGQRVAERPGVGGRTASRGTRTAFSIESRPMPWRSTMFITPPGTPKTG